MTDRLMYLIFYTVILIIASISTYLHFLPVDILIALYSGIIGHAFGVLQKTNGVNPNGKQPPSYPGRTP